MGYIWRRGVMRIAVILVVSVLVISGIIGVSIRAEGEEYDEELRYVSRGVIRINGDADFTSANGVTDGSGTVSDPYLISGWSIDASSHRAGIYVGNTTKYFKILNCRVKNAKAASGFFYIGMGIEIYNAKNGVIENVESTSNYQYGIYVSNSENIEIRKATLYKNGYGGIYVDNSPSTVISNSRLTENGISMDESDNSRIDGNFLTGAGVYVSDSKGTYVSNNSIMNVDTYGIKFYRVGYSWINGNTVVNASKGIYLDTCISTNIIERNDVSDGYDGIYLSMSRNVIVRNNTLRNNTFDAKYHNIYVSWGSSVTLENNSVVGGLYGIFLSNSRQNIIRYNSLKENYESVHLEKSDNNKVWYNNCLGSGTAFTRDGIYVKDSNYVDMRENNCSWLSYGIDLYGAENATIAKNRVYHNSVGIGLSSDSNYAMITENEISENGGGINIQQSSHTDINNNTFRANRDNGIYIMGKSSDVVDNIFVHNYRVAFIDHSSGMNVIRNKVMNNTLGMLVESSFWVFVKFNVFTNQSYFGVNVSSSAVVVLENNNVSYSEEGIVEYKSSNVKIGYNVIFNNTLGIHVLNSSWSGIYDAVLYNNENGGFRIDGSNNITVGNVNSSSNSGFGLGLVESENVSLSGCICVHNGKDGVYIYNSTEVLIERSNVSENHYAGIYAVSSDNGFYGGTTLSVSIIDSVITDNNYEGINIESNSRYNKIKMNNLIITGNNGNGTRVNMLYSYGYLYLENTTLYNNYGNVYIYTEYENLNVFVCNNTVVHSEDNGLVVVGKSVVIKNNVVSYNAKWGIFTYAFSSVIINNTVEYNSFGIHQAYGKGSILNNTVTHNARDGIRLSDRITEVVIDKNIIVHNVQNGIHGIGLFSADIRISNSTVSYNDGHGIFFEAAGPQMLKVYNNTVSHNGGDGMRVIAPYIALGNLIMAFNTISYNDGNGTTLMGAEEIYIYRNLFLNNTGYGLALEKNERITLSHLEIYENSFIYNHGSNESYDKAHVQGFDNIGANEWDNGEDKGNYWGDWIEPDRDGDGIVDEPYVLDGTAGAEDAYPLVSPDVPIPEFGSWLWLMLVVLLIGVLLRRNRS